jgi:hypothetical protein
MNSGMKGFAKSIRRILRVAKCNLLDEPKNDITSKPRELRAKH